MPKIFLKGELSFNSNNFLLYCYVEAKEMVYESVNLKGVVYN